MKWVFRAGIAVLLLLAAVAGVAVATALRTERPVGFQRVQTADPHGKPFSVGIWYPTDARPWPTAFALTGLMDVAKNAPVAGNALPLIVISHGNGGSFASHSDLAMALANAGYVVAAPTHPGDNYLDQSAILSARFASDRTRQLSATIDYMLADWTGHERIDAARIGAFGFSMGGFTVLTAVGARPDLRGIASHCAQSADPLCTGLRQARSPLLDPDAVAGDKVAPDPRIRTAVLAAPGLEFTFTNQRLAPVAVPVQMWSAARDRNVKDSRTIRNGLGSRVEFHEVPNAGHYSFMAPCLVLKPRVLCTDPPGFDRKGFHAHMNAAVAAFFSTNLDRP
ncbi:dienelactone hydrolase family protein [Massilia sp. UMI-21]|nr:dienelactone hydrolase family protein [Massilia sp. UMI-21]